MTRSEEDIIKQKVQYFFDKKLAVHIALKNSRFFNGKILEFSKDLLMIDDKFLGATPIYLPEIKFVEPFKDLTNGKGK